MLKSLVKFVDSIVEKLNTIFPPVLVQFGIYAGIGVLGALWDIGIFAVMNMLLGSNLLILSFFTGKTIGIIHNFFLNAIFNFKANDNLLRRFAKFYLIGLIGIGVGAVALQVAVKTLGFNSLISNIVITFIVALIQFGINRVVTFKK
jgi:putative flippase GtrA